MIIAIGIDIVEISRIEETMARQGERFLKRVFTLSERGYCDGRSSRIASYAARFAAKEAVMKALGTGWDKGISWQDIEVIRGESGPPSIHLAGLALERFHSVGGKRIHLSLSHSRDTAIAQVIFET